jgi:hypothetical protein
VKISRRNFVGTASCAAAGALCSLPPRSLAATKARPAHRTCCSLLDLKSRCVLPESFDGYRLALGDEHRSLSEIELDSRDVHRAIIVPAAGTIDSTTRSALSAALTSGTTIVWESAAAFLSPSDFTTQQEMLREHFAITIGQPTNLWSSHSPKPLSAKSATIQPRKSNQFGHAQIPYVTYDWPHETRVRDFTRAIPVSAKTGRAIAHLGHFAVAWRKQIGRGSFIFLGSPIGPALRAGDPEAATWLRAVISESA